MAAERFEDLMYKLGDLARERLAERPDRPRSMERVFMAEEALVRAREELAGLEHEINEEDEGYQAFLEQQKAERGELTVTVQKWRKAVEVIEGRTKSVRKKLVTKRAEFRLHRAILHKQEEKQRTLDETYAHEPNRIAEGREILKKLRIAQMRRQREIEEIEYEFNAILTPRPGQPGAQGILAHKRLLELDDEAEDRKHHHETRMADLEQALAVKDDEVNAAEDFLDQAIFLLAEECYAQRLAEPALAAIYPHLDRFR